MDLEKEPLKGGAAAEAEGRAASAAATRGTLGDGRRRLCMASSCLCGSVLLFAGGAAAASEAGTFLAPPPPSHGHRRLQAAQTFQGGGLRSFGALTGLTTGLLAALDPDDDKAGLEQLFGNMDAFAASSGGSWYIMQLLYSQRFQELHYLMMREPSKAGELFNDKWTRALMEWHYHPAYHPDMNWQKDVGRCLESLLPKLRKRRLASTSLDQSKAGNILVLIEQALDLLHLLSRQGGIGGRTWVDLIEILMERPAGLEGSMPLSSAPNSFGRGRLLAATATVAAPGSWFNFSDGLLYLRPAFEAALLGPSVASYKAKSSQRRFQEEQLVPPFLPAKFTFWLGDGPTATAPFSFCGAEDCFGLHFEYAGRGGGEGPVLRSEELARIYESGFTQSAGRLPINTVAAASSAFAGSVIMSQAPAILRAWHEPGEADGIQVAQEIINETASCINLAVWASDAPGGRAFQHAADERLRLYDPLASLREGIKKAAADGVHGLMDGGYTDNLGVASILGIMTSSAVSEQNESASQGNQSAGSEENPSAGSEENSSVAHLSVRVFLSGYDAPHELLELFAQATDQNATGEEGELPPLGPIFDAPSAEEAGKIFWNSPSFQPEAGTEDRFLDNITYGTIRGCMTTENHWFGVRAGFNVTLHFVWVPTALGIGGTDSSYDYGILAGEVATTLARNAANVRSEILEAFNLGR